jgi:histidinol dehydrogenase
VWISSKTFFRYDELLLANQLGLTEMKVVIYDSLKDFQQATPPEFSEEISNIVREIIAQVRAEGDRALKQLTDKFDGVNLGQVRVPNEYLKACLERMDASLRGVLEEASENIRRFHQRQKQQSQIEFEPDGTLLGWKVTPVDAAGVYVPGGRAVYPSTLLMNAIPAQVAGVPRLVIVSPPNRKTGFPHSLVCGAAALVGVEEVYAVGGAQSVAALAYGTESIQRVVKITGPGNAYVAEAKRQVYGIVGIDSIAGPSEIMVVCDREDIPVEFLVRDLLSQAEHDPDAGAVLVTTSRSQAKAVAKRLEDLIPSLPRKEILQESFRKRSGIIVAETLEEIFEAINEIAPEHLEVLTQNPMGDLHRIRNAGAIFLGPHTPEPVGDYFAGPNHILPTSGAARFASPLGVSDFVKTSSILSYSKSKLQQQGPSVMRFAQEEGLFAHSEAIRVRLESSY